MLTSHLDIFIQKMNNLGKKGIPFLFIIDYEMNNPVIHTFREAAKEGIYFSVHGRRNKKKSVLDELKLGFNKKVIDFPFYQNAFQKVLRQIYLGNTFLLNLTFPTEIETNWSLERIYAKSNAPYRLLFKDKFAVFSPECFVRISKGEISSFPMKGTIDAAIEHAVDIIMADEKEKAEHATIVDLIRNDLSMVANNVHVKRYRYLDEIVTHDKRLLQVSSEISGILPTDYQSNIGSIVCKLLPAGSICGAPKDSTLKIIKEVEGYQRGYYTGVFGIFDGKNLDSAVMIRFIEQINGKLFYKSGGGITIHSDPEKEYNELIDKIYVTAH
ncbi:MAG: aminodeoxychorismate synthase component I [Prolixibacteraceae bacterium]|jgi:para-aminobenzoate synthetase component 1|nr:aminodeoxychorismate synthase component I [Prolixibacteraceae bacterium]